jgi:hypothetical protein
MLTTLLLADTKLVNQACGRENGPAARRAALPGGRDRAVTEALGGAGHGLATGAGAPLKATSSTVCT